MAKIRKVYWLEPSEQLKVDKLAKRLKLTPSQVVDMMSATYDYKLWLQTLKIKHEAKK